MKRENMYSKVGFGGVDKFNAGKKLNCKLRREWGQLADGWMIQWPTARDC